MRLTSGDGVRMARDRSANTRSYGRPAVQPHGQSTFDVVSDEWLIASVFVPGFNRHSVTTKNSGDSQHELDHGKPLPNADVRSETEGEISVRGNRILSLG